MEKRLASCGISPAERIYQISTYERLIQDKRYANLSAVDRIIDKPIMVGDIKIRGCIRRQILWKKGYITERKYKKEYSQQCSIKHRVFDIVDQLLRAPLNTIL